MHFAALDRFCNARSLLGLVARLALGFFLLVSALQSALGQTLVNGSISAPTRWTVASSPYLVTGDVVLQDYAVLTIDPGVTIYMGANASLSVQNASIIALGTSASPIRVDSDKTRVGLGAAAGDWRQWIFLPSPVNSRLENVIFERGRGLSIKGSSPTLNYVTLKNHLGAAITLDLAASPTGLGLQAEGNTVNGIAVPSGDITTNLVWGLRGIPYVLSAGTLSVGTTPSVQSITPSVVERGQTTTVTLSGSRLGGVGRLVWDGADVSSTVFPGASDNQVNLQVTVGNAAPVGPMGFQLLVDAGQIHVLPGVIVSPPTPAVTGVNPDSVETQAGVIDVTVTGRNFLTSSEVLVNTAAAVTRFISASELRFTLPNQTAVATLQIQVRSPDPARDGQYLVSGQQALVVRAATPPAIAVEPAPIAIPPDNKLHAITVRLSKPDYRDNRLNFQIADSSKASVSPSTMLIPAGQTTAKIYVSAAQPATTTLQITSANLAAVDVPVFVSGDFSSINTAYASPVGVLIGEAVPPQTSTRMATHTPVGVVVGGVLTGVSPRGMSVGSSTALTIQGLAIPAGARISLVPGDGLSVESTTVDAQGTRLQATLRASADAAPGGRRLRVQDADGAEIPFADPALAVFNVALTAPTLASVEPFVAERGQITTLTVRGKGLAQGAVALEPASGLQLDSQPQISADGTRLTVRVAIAADAALGARVLRVTTPAGASSSAPGPENTFTIASKVDTVTSGLVAPIVGVRVGEPPVPPPVTVDSLQASANVGVLVGSVVTGFTPHVAVVGNDVVLTVRGIGLQELSAAELAPNTGISLVGTPVLNAQGTEAQLTLRVDAAATQGLRGISFKAGDQVLAKLPADLGGVLITAPLPELVSVDPQVLLAGDASSTKMSLRGRNFSNVSAVRIVPGDGVTISGLLQASADGTQLSFYAQAALGASSGTRTVVVTTAAGDSSLAAAPSNQIQIAIQVGPTYANVMSLPVGVRVGDVPPPPVVTDTYTLVSGLVGVKVGELEPLPNPPSATVSGAVGLLVGAGAQTVSPSGWLQGSSGTLSITGQGLQSVTSVTVTPDTGILLGTPVASADGKRIEMSIALTTDTTAQNRRLRLITADGEVLFVNDAAATLGVGQIPTLNSIAPVVLAQGESATMRVRGSQLRSVFAAQFEPASGIVFGSAPVWGQDSFGEFVTFTVRAADDATVGQRVLRLLVPGGATPAAAAATNTLTIVPAR